MAKATTSLSWAKGTYKYTMRFRLVLLCLCTMSLLTPLVYNLYAKMVLKHEAARAQSFSKNWKDDRPIFFSLTVHSDQAVEGEGAVERRALTQTCLDSAEEALRSLSFHRRRRRNVFLSTAQGPLKSNYI